MVRAMESVVEGLGCDLPGAEGALDGVAAGLTPSGRHIALAWSAEVTVGLLTVVSLATGDDEADLLSQLAERDLDPAGRSAGVGEQPTYSAGGALRARLGATRGGSLGCLG